MGPIVHSFRFQKLFVRINKLNQPDELSKLESAERLNGGSEVILAFRGGSLRSEGGPREKANPH